MAHHIWTIFLIVVCIIPFAKALEPGDKVPDFVMPSSNGAPERLSEKIGKPVMLIWLDDCDPCEEALINWQYLAESWALEGLEAWFIWHKKSDYPTPRSRLPVLEYETSNRDAWWFESAPAVMLISPEGVLDYLFIDNVDVQRLEVTNKLKHWLNDKKWLQ
jgi:hypothetical protein